MNPPRTPCFCRACRRGLLYTVCRLNRMQTKRHDNLVAVRLFSGEDLHGSLSEACSGHGVEAAVVLSGLGQLKDFELGYFRQKGDYCPQHFADAHELVSLTGTISRQDGEYVFHLHATLTDRDKRAVGGHLIRGTVQVTNEIVLLETGMKITRRIDEKTGLKGLFLEGDEAPGRRPTGFAGEVSPREGDRARLKWYFSTHWVVIALLCVGPLALPLVWLHPRYKIVTKLAVTLIVIAVAAVCWHYTKGLYDELLRQLNELNL